MTTKPNRILPMVTLLTLLATGAAPPALAWDPALPSEVVLTTSVLGPGIHAECGPNFARAEASWPPGGSGGARAGIAGTTTYQWTMAGPYWMEAAAHGNGYGFSQAWITYQAAGTTLRATASCSSAWLAQAAPEVLRSSNGLGVGCTPGGHAFMDGYLARDSKGNFWMQAIRSSPEGTSTVTLPFEDGRLNLAHDSWSPYPAHLERLAAPLSAHFWDQGCTISLGAELPQAQDFS